MKMRRRFFRLMSSFFGENFELFNYSNLLLGVQKKQEKIILEIESFKGDPLDLQDLKNKLIFLKGEETKIRKESEEALDLEKYIKKSFPYSQDDCIKGRDFLEIKLDLIFNSQEWKFFKEELLLGKYDKTFKNNRSFVFTTNKIILFFKLNKDLPSDKRILEFVVSYIFFYVNKRKFEGFNIKIAKFFDMSLYFSITDNFFHYNFLYLDINKILKRFSKEAPLGGEGFKNLMLGYKKVFTKQFENENLELYSVLHLWFIFTSLILLREYLLGYSEVLFKFKKEKISIKFQILTNLFLPFAYNIRFLCVFLGMGKLGSCEILNQLFFCELYKVYKKFRNFWPMTLSLDRGGKRFEGRLKFFVTKSTYVCEKSISSWRDPFVFREFKLGTFYKSNNFTLNREDLTVLYKDTFFYRFRNCNRSDLIFCYFPFLFYDSSYNNSRFGVNFFHPGTKFLNEVKLLDKKFIFKNKK